MKKQHKPINMVESVAEVVKIPDVMGKKTTYMHEKSRKCCQVGN